MLSSEAEELDPNGLEKAGIGRVLPKPVVASHLMEAILDEIGVSETGYAPTADVFLKKTMPRLSLLAEDNPLIQQVMIGFLENWGHQVILSEYGRIALEFATNERFDLVLMDVEMPDGTTRSLPLSWTDRGEPDEEKALPESGVHRISGHASIEILKVIETWKGGS